MGRQNGLREKCQVSESIENRFYEDVKQINDEMPAAYRQKRFEEVEAKLLNILAISNGTEQRLCALDMLVNHYHLVGKMQLALNAIHERISAAPQQVEGLLGLAEHFHYYEVDLARAAKYIEAALQEGFAQGEFVRQVLGVRIRIALARKDYSIVKESIAMLLDYRPTPGKIDVALEQDFVSEIPAGVVDSEVLNRYVALASKGGRN